MPIPIRRRVTKLIKTKTVPRVRRTSLGHTKKVPLKSGGFTRVFVPAKKRIIAGQPERRISGPAIKRTSSKPKRKQIVIPKRKPMPTSKIRTKYVTLAKPVQKRRIVESKLYPRRSAFIPSKISGTVYPIRTVVKKRKRITGRIR